MGGSRAPVGEGGAVVKRWGDHAEGPPLRPQAGAGLEPPPVRTPGEPDAEGHDGGDSVPSPRRSSADRGGREGAGRCCDRGGCPLAMGETPKGPPPGRGAGPVGVRASQAPALRASRNVGPGCASTNEDNFMRRPTSPKEATGLVGPIAPSSWASGGRCSGSVTGWAAPLARSPASSPSTSSTSALAIGGPPRITTASPPAWSTRHRGRRAAHLRRGQARPHSAGHGRHTATASPLLGDTSSSGRSATAQGYILQGERLVQVTRDQSPRDQLIEAGQPLTEEEAETFDYGNIILQALGTAGCRPGPA